MPLSWSVWLLGILPVPLFSQGMWGKRFWQVTPAALWRTGQALRPHPVLAAAWGCSACPHPGSKRGAFKGTRSTGYPSWSSSPAPYQASSPLYPCFSFFFLFFFPFSFFFFFSSSVAWGDTLPPSCIRNCFPLPKLPGFLAVLPNQGNLGDWPCDCRCLCVLLFLLRSTGCRPLAQGTELACQEKGSTAAWALCRVLFGKFSALVVVGREERGWAALESCTNA